LNRGQENTLLARLRAAENSISEGQDATACSEVGVFIKLVQAYMKRGTLTQTEGQSLIEAPTICGWSSVANSHSQKRKTLAGLPQPGEAGKPVFSFSSSRGRLCRQ